MVALHLPQSFGSDILTVLSGSVSPVGGTSASAPTVAGIFALFNDAVIQSTGKPLGFVNPLIYQVRHIEFNSCVHIDCSVVRSTPASLVFLSVTSHEFSFQTSVCLSVIKFPTHQMWADEPAAFRDITVGDNACTEDGCLPGCYGFKAAKGWGTPPFKVADPHPPHPPPSPSSALEFEHYPLIFHCLASF